MNIWKNKAKGYSLIETIIAVFITTMVVAVAFGIFFSYNKVFKKYSEVINETNSVVTVNKILEQDFSNAKIVKGVSDKEVKLFYINKKSISYKTVNGNLVRYHLNKIDTLYQDVGNLILSKIESSNLIDYYGITLFEDNYQYSLNFEKSYSPDILITELGQNGPNQSTEISN
jgi:Tfp pilus assembly protein PilE